MEDEKEKDGPPIIAFKRVYKHSNAVVLGIPHAIRKRLGIGKGTHVRMEVLPGSKAITVTVQR